MSHPRSRSKTATCFLLSGVIFALILIALLGLPRVIITRAEAAFGPASSDLPTVQRAYLAALLLLQSSDLTQPTDPAGTETLFSIQLGESVPSIVGRLWDAGLISNPGVFRSYLQFTGLDMSLQAGDHVISPAMSPIEIAQAIQSSISPDVTLSILPGWRLEEIAQSLPSTGLNITPAEFTLAVSRHFEGYSFSTCLAGASLEGFLFPGVYTLPRETTIEQLLPQLLMNFESQVTSELRDGFTNQGLNVCQAVTLASIVQREAVLAEEMPLIASVFYNRLSSGDVLASDPTVQYALGFNQSQGTWWTNPLSWQDLEVDSTYNTYLHAGLPPGPISNPGLEAIQAVAFPAQTAYFYFRSACDGSGRHLFAETFAEHVGNECP